MLPKDPIMFLSYVNTQLRYNYSNIDDFCSAFNITKEEVYTKLESINYFYDEESNQFK